ncbi:MAG TPA: MlaD family protein [Burkholderiales bacterium]|nr:MlaD family protein [Burkholderiales bacterium]
MENRAHALAAGLFTILLGAALITTAMWFNKDDVVLQRYDIVTTQSVSGLKVDAPVRYRGVEVGRVSDIRIEPGPGGRIRIELGVRPDTPVTKGTYAQLGYQGVTGLALVTLNDNGASPEPLRSKGRQVAQLPLRASLLDDGEDLLGSVSEIADRLNSLLDDDNQAMVKRTLAGLERVSRSTSQLAERLGSEAGGVPALVADARAAIRDARATAAKADTLLASLNALSARVDERLEVVGRVSNTVDDVGGTARAFNDETLPRLNALVDELSHETRALDRLLNTIGEHPQSIVFGAPPRRPGPGEPGYGATR